MVLFYWLICAVIGIGLGYWVWRKDRKSSHRLKWLPSLLRGLSGFIISALLLAPILNFETNTHHKPIIVWLQDNSQSVALGLKGDTTTFREKKKQLSQKIDDKYELVGWQFGKEVEQNDATDFSQAATNIQQALLHIHQRYKGSNLGAIILPSDGIYNTGQDPVYAMPNLEVPLYTIGLGDTQQQKDISVLRIFANKVVMSGNSFEVAADVHFASYEGSSHQVILKQNGTNIKQQTISVTEADETAAVSFEVQAGAPGLIHFAIEVPVADGERTDLNNVLDFYVQVVNNEVKILVLNAGVHPDLGLIRNALRTTAGYEITLAAPNTLPEDWKDYHSIIAFQPALSAAHWNQIIQSEKPVWHILGNLTKKEQIDALKTSGTAERRREGIFHSPRYENAFSTFILPLQAQQVLSALPPLESSIQNFKPTAGAAILMYSKEHQSPTWIVHAGAKAPQAVTIGEGLWRWAIFEYRDHKSQLVTQDLVRQTMRSLNVPRQDKPFQIFLSKRMITNQENISFTAELRNKTGELINQPPVKLMIQDSSGINKEFEMEPFGSAYQLILPAMGEGLYQYEGTVNYEGNSYRDQGTFAVENIPLEQLNTQADFAMMYQLASQSDGRFFTLENMDQLSDSLLANPNITETIVSEQKKEPLIDFRWLFAILLLLLSAEWYYRKFHGMM